MLALHTASDLTINASYIALAAYALLGRAHAIRALAVVWLFTMLNPALAPEASLGTLGRYIVLFTAAASVLLHSGFGLRHLAVHRFTLATIVLGLSLSVIQ